MKKSSILRTWQKGFSLVELSVVLVVVFGLLGLGLVAAPQLFSSLNSVSELSELPTVIMNIKKNSKNSSTYNGVTLDTLARSNVFPENRVTIPTSGTSTATNQWGGGVTVTVATLTTTDDIVRLVSRSVPHAECIEVVQGVAKMLRRVYVDSANSGTVGAGTLVKDDGAVINNSTLASACGTGANSITYDIGKS